MVLKITQVKEIIKTVFLYGMKGRIVKSRMILGPPGIGKTEIIRQVAHEVAEILRLPYIEYDEGGFSIDEIKAYVKGTGKAVFYVYTNLNEIEAADLTGLPRNEISINAVRFRPLLWALVCSKQPCIVHLDEITSVIDDAVKSAAMKLLCEKMAGYVKLHPATLVVATGNNPEENSMAQLLPAPFVNKVVQYQVGAPTVEEWGEYMINKYGEEWEQTTFAYLQEHRYDFIKVPKEGETLQPYPTPRSWETLANDIWILRRDGASREYIKETVVGTVGKQVASRYMTYLETRVDAEKVFFKPDIYTRLKKSAKYLVAIWLANRMNENTKRYMRHFEWLFKIDTERAVIVLALMKEEALSELAPYIVDKPEIIERLLTIAESKAKIFKG